MILAAWLPLCKVPIHTNPITLAWLSATSTSKAADSDVSVFQIGLTGPYGGQFQCHCSGIHVEEKEVGLGNNLALLNR